MDRRSGWFRVLSGCGVSLALAATVVVAEELVAHTDAPCGESASAIASEIVACDSGGEGAISCETKWTVNIGGWGWPSGCGISCADGHYACCADPTWYRNATCSCVANPPRPVPLPPPPGPESPGL